MLIIAALVSSIHVASPSLDAVRSDTLRLEVGSPEVDGRIYPPHKARNRVYAGETDSVVTEWTNELTLGDSAGRRVMRWVTRGKQAGGVTWELLQTYDARTLAPYAYSYSSSAGGSARLTFDGPRVRGSRVAGGAAATMQDIDRTLTQAAFMANASDLVPLAVGLKKGAIMSAPVWSPGMANSEVRVFTVLDQVPVKVEGSTVQAWKVTEHRQSDAKLVATWYLTESSPYMVFAEVVLPNGAIQRMSGVSLDGK